MFFVNCQNAQATQASAENTWQTLASLRESLAGNAVTVDDKIYIFGGNTQEFGLFVYDPQNQTLTQTASMPTYRTSFGIAVVDHKIYTIGGQGASGQVTTPTNINEVYDTQTGTWETKQPTIDTGSRMIANAVNGKIYVTAYSNMDVYDPEADNWTRISALPQEVSEPQYSCAIDDKIYIIKDSTGDAYYIPNTIGEGKLHIYDATTKNWSTGATLPTFYKQSRLVTTTGEHAPKQIYVVGGMIIHGFTDYEGVNASFRYDPAADSWSRAADMHIARYEAAVAAVEDKIYAIGGATKPSEGWLYTLTGAVEVYTPFGYGTMQASASPSNSTNPWLVLPDATAVIVGVAVGAAIAGTVIAATTMLLLHRKQTKTAKQSKPSN